MAGQDSRLVLDCGTWKVRAGYAGEEAPFFNRHASCFYDTQATSFSRNNNFMEDGKVVDWDMLETVIKRFFEESRQGEADPTRSLLFLDHFHDSIHDHVKLLETVFEKIGYCRYLSTDQAVACTYATGYLTSTTVLMGYSSTELAGVYEWFILSYLKTVSPLSGSLVVDVFKDKIESAFKSQPIPVTDYEAAFRQAISQSEAMQGNEASRQVYELADGTKVSLADQAQSAVEVLLDPSSVGCNSAPLPELIFKKLWQIEDFDLRKQMFDRVHFAGGIGCIPSFRAKLIESIQSMLPKKWRVNQSRYNTTSDQTIAAWIGGSVLGSLNSTEDYWVTKHQYAEEGDSAVFRRVLL